jgi:uncharacterized protein YhbP (UPF0306 family)
MDDIDWNKLVKEALDRTEFMAISTVGEDGSWTNPVQYGYSEKLNLYFVSMMDAKHVQNLLKDPRVSAAIYKTERFPGPAGDVLGLQLKGTAKHLTDLTEINEAIRCYGGRPSDPWNFFKITLTELWCFDSRIFGERRERVNLETISVTIK